MDEEIKSLYNDFFNKNRSLNREDIEEINKEIESLKSQVSSLQKNIMELGRLTHYDST